MTTYIDWYSHIAESSDDLREQIKQMRRDGLSPKKFGLYVLDHPDRLLVTAANKMRTGEKRIFKHNFSGRLVESYVLSSDEKNAQSNRELIHEYWSSGFGKGLDSIEETEKGWIVRDANLHQVAEFLNYFLVHENFLERRSAVVTYIKSIAEMFPDADVLFVSVGESLPGSLGSQIRKSAELKDGGYWRLKKDRVASRGDEKLGLDADQKKEAELLADESGKNPSDFHYRSVRKKPLLMLHALDLGDGEDKQLNMPAFGISFPPGDYSEGVSVVANTVWVDQLHGGVFDAPEDEDDDE